MSRNGEPFQHNHSKKICDSAILTQPDVSSLRSKVSQLHRDVTKKRVILKRLLLFPSTSLHAPADISLRHRDVTTKYVILALFFLFPFIAQDRAENVETVMDCFVQEELPPNATVGNVIQDYGLYRKYNTSVLARLRFSFMTLPAGDKQYFAVGEASGVIRTATRIDREELCPRADYCFLKFDVAVQPIEFFQIIKVRVEILDVNDNPPSFPHPSVSFELSEAADPGASFLLPPADDLDSARNGVVRYELSPPRGAWELVVRARGDGSASVRVVLREGLDREARGAYRLSLVAVDGGEPVRSATLDVNIAVLDANDNAPQFVNATYEVKLREDAGVGTSVFRARATDRDTGVNGQVGYLFTKDTLEEHGGTFSIGPDTGLVVTRGRLDYEARSEYLLYIAARDRGIGEVLSAQTILVIQVEDINDNPPTIRIRPSPSHHSPGGAQGSSPELPAKDPEVLEESDPGAFVAHVSVEDLDSGNNGKFHCSIADSNLFELKQLYTSEFKVVTLAKFDRELCDSYEFGIMCRDSGWPALTSMATVKVKVADRNDHSPAFLREIYRITVEENAPIGQNIGRVTATDRDIGSNGDVEYFIEDEAMGKLFGVDRQTGVLTTRVGLDREQGASVELNVTARDQGSPGRESQARVQVSVRDEDDEQAHFAHPNYTFTTEEHRPSGITVGTVTAIDRDSPPYNFVLYYIAPPESDFFAINRTSGKITTRESLDREVCSGYDVTVMAVSTLRRHPMTSSAVVRINVADVNDHRPVFEFPSRKNDHIQISGLTPRGHVIARVKVRDDDANLNAKIIYRISGGNEIEAFKIDADSGEIHVTGDLSDVSTVTLEITASDFGDPPLKETAVLRVEIRGDLPAPTSGHVMALLASEELAIVLAILLAAILVAISVVVSIVLFVRRRRSVVKRREVATANGEGKDWLGNRGDIQLKEGAFERYSCASGGDGGGGGGSLYGCNKITALEIQALQGRESEPSMNDSPTHRPVVGFIRDYQLKKVSPNSESNSDSGRGPSSEDGEQACGRPTPEVPPDRWEATSGPGPPQLKASRQQGRDGGLRGNGTCALDSQTIVSRGSLQLFHNPRSSLDRFGIIHASNFHSLTDVRAPKHIFSDPYTNTGDHDLPTGTGNSFAKTLDHRQFRRNSGNNSQFHTSNGIRHVMPLLHQRPGRMYSTLASPRYAVIHERVTSPLHSEIRNRRGMTSSPQRCLVVERMTSSAPNERLLPLSVDLSCGGLVEHNGRESPAKQRIGKSTVRRCMDIVDAGHSRAKPNAGDVDEYSDENAE